MQARAANGGGDKQRRMRALEQARALAQEQESPLFTSRIAESMERVAAQTV